MSITISSRPDTSLFFFFTALDPFTPIISMHILHIVHYTLLNPLSPNINMHILITVLHMLLILLIERI